MATFSSAAPAAFTSYSSFFSSGLLAPHTPRRCERRGTFSSDTSEGYVESDSAPPSPSQPSSPGMLLPEEHATPMDIDMADFAISRKDKDMERRSATPTPHTLIRDGSTTPMQSPRLGKATPLRPHTQSHLPMQTDAPQPQPQPQAQAQAQQPRLRRRRSSLTQGTSPMGAIRSPTRAAGAALQVQKAVSRGRSGSLGGDVSVMTAGAGGGYHTRSSTAGVATEATSLVGRMRSGSCSNVGGPPSSGASVSPTNVRPRRALRRILTTPVPGIRAPPPTTPLPALPPVPSAPHSASFHQLQHQPRSTKINFGPETTGAPSSPPGASTKPTGYTSARARGLSVSSSTLSGEENRIDEDMKEN
ncbi:hypothetical protein BDN70DRAFT_360516 [Pholiota conissans]|uniref:Uncharacterized protein n=1 Tax=Pholiota conissans TaxID=109636 RepID=A0A9P5ZAT7_9AGAR|nr:hypothetical protein BDN70DRAFT_360516 [Pholiota conissans]